MSNKAQAWAWDIEWVSSTQKLVLVRLADHANASGRCYPGKDSIAKATCLSRRAVDNAIKQLAELGLIDIIEEQTDTGRQLANSYQLHVDQVELFERAAKDTRTPAGNAGVQHVRGRRTCGGTPQEVRGDPAGGAGTAPAGAAGKPSVEPSGNPQRGRARGTRLPPGWHPSAKVMDWARREFPLVELQYETEKFTDHWKSQPGQRGVKLDWVATWKNWIRKADEYRQIKRNGTGETAVQARERRNREAFARGG